MKTYKFKIEGLDCANCANELEEALKRIDIIDQVSISFMMQRLTFQCQEEQKEDAVTEIKKVIKKKEPEVMIREM